MKPWRAVLAFIAVAVSMWAASAPARAADNCAAYAHRKITLVVPFKPGGGYDAYARLLAPVLQETTGSRVVVTNITGANGVSGMKAVASAPTDNFTLGVFDLRDLLAARLTDATLPAVQDFVALGSFGSTAGVWAARQSTAHLLDGRGALTFGVSTGILARVLLPAMLLEREVRLVRGYAGSTERWLALLRGEVDLTDGSEDSIARYVSTSPGTAGVLVLADHPLAQFPGAPYLAGPGGVVDERTRMLAPLARRERMELAALCAELATSVRTIAIARSVDPAARRCIESAVGEALFSPALREAAARQKAPLEPQRGTEVRESLLRMEQAMKRREPLLKRLAAGS
ncbi:MAG TPA: hypothetical protein VHA82_06585 [Ramlibacter sp.]|uniref:Bug family tripartite tricarboxylate transporter substrate binding protein n=1 Tax=Ramlibacter sp. TaxID=1917967 RepID=UPI002C420E32|nr:hypothetical protein [Ramlibacter sp.]HVZ43459.1 hypothetical protein [Ramlibacter sp.]